MELYLNKKLLDIPTIYTLDELLKSVNNDSELKNILKRFASLRKVRHLDDDVYNFLVFYREHSERLLPTTIKDEEDKSFMKRLEGETLEAYSARMKKYEGYLDDDTILYIYNSLFSCKGTGEVLHILDKLLYLNGAFEIKDDYKYEMPAITLNINKIMVNDIAKFVDLLKKALEHLLFYQKFSSVIDEWILKFHDTESSDFITEMRFFCIPFKKNVPEVQTQNEYETDGVLY